MVYIIQAARLSILIVSTAFTDRPSQPRVLSISSVDSDRSPRKSVSMDVHPSPGTHLFAPSLPSSSAFNPPIKSTAIFGDPATFLLPLSVRNSPTKEGLERAQSPASPSPPRRNLTAADGPLPLSKDRVPSSVSPEALKFPQFQPEGLDPKKMKGLAGNIGALLLGSKRRAEDDGCEGDTFASTECMSGGRSKKRPCRPISRAKVRAQKKISSSIWTVRSAVSDRIRRYIYPVTDAAASVFCRHGRHGRQSAATGRNRRWGKLRCAL